MKKSIYFTLLFFSLIGIATYAQNTPNMKRLNIEEFKKNADGGTWYFQEGDTMIVIVGRKGYNEERRHKDEQLTINYEYDREGRLLKSYTKVSGAIYGITKEYDPEGNMIKETNEDVLYPFSLDDLRKLILEKYNRDIYKVYPPTGVRRIDRDNQFNLKPTYRVTIGRSSLDPNFQSLKINGTTGEILIIRDQYFKIIYDNGGIYRETKKQKDESISQAQARQSWIDKLFG